MTGEEREAIRPILRDAENPVCIELGAYCGEDEHIFRSLAHPKDLLLIMVEPDPRNYAIIETKPLNHMRRLIRGAVSAQRERREFRFSYDTRDGSRGSGSLRQPTGHLEHFPTISFSEPTMVECFALNRIFLDHQITKIDLLWVDIQGAEKEMIEGGRHALFDTHWLFMEAEEIQMYEGQALKHELIDLMGPAWELSADFGYNILLRNKMFEKRPADRDGATYSRVRPDGAL